MLVGNKQRQAILTATLSKMGINFIQNQSLSDFGAGRWCTSTRRPGLMFEVERNKGSAAVRVDVVALHWSDGRPISMLKHPLSHVWQPRPDHWLLSTAYFLAASTSTSRP